ncbi:MAG TPA: polyprenyl synthetase family protein [Pyrinomonadaceae bacterium]|nr:polyprenyl synthetase family protein [Pyrinomonadaceae bacterium]
MQTFSVKTARQNSELTARKIFDLIKPELALVEAEYERQANSNIQVISYLGDYLRASGGKRIRPALFILACYTAGGDGARESAIRMATVMEMLHTATLVHDDIIDNADTRRNHASVNARFGNQTAVLMGDWLYMTAFETSLRERSLEILDILTRVTRKMTEGELIQLTVLGKTDLTEEEYFEILKRKTAFLFSACCEIGAILGNAPAEHQTAHQSALRDYGMNLGIAFQLADDLLDFTASEKELGKAAGADLLEGKMTLPLIMLLQQQPGMKESLEKVMYEGDYAAVSRGSLLSTMHESGIFEATLKKAHNYAEEARKNLAGLPKTQYSSMLADIPSYIIERNK